MKNLFLKDFCKILSLAALLLSAVAPGESSAFTGSGKGDFEELVNPPGSYNIVGVALFSGEGLISEGIKKATHSDLSHVGLILADSENENAWYCLESTGKEGVHISDWTGRAGSYQGDVRYRLFVFEDERINNELVVDAIDSVDGNPYPKTFWPLIKAWLGLNREKDSNERPLFCSELVAELLMTLDLISDDRVAGNYFPSDFDLGGRLVLTEGLELTDCFPFFN